jgi:hypothetical protein
MYLRWNWCREVYKGNVNAQKGVKERFSNRNLNVKVFLKHQLLKR